MAESSPHVLFILNEPTSIVDVVPLASVTESELIQAVKEVKVVDVGINSFILTWKRTPGVTGYKISWSPFHGEEHTHACMDTQTLTHKHTPPKLHILPTIATCMLSLAGPHIRRQTHWLQVIYKSLQGKAPPYLSSLVTLAAPTRSTRSSRYISPKPIPPLVALLSSSLLPMTGTNCKHHWSWRLISPLLTLSTSCQRSSQMTAPVHSQFVNSPSNYLTPYTVIYLFIFAPLHPSISTCTFIFCTSITPMFNCYIVITSPPWPIYCLYLPYLTSFAHTVYRLFYCIIDCMFVYSMCNSVCCLCRTALLYLDQVAVVNENLFSTSL